MGDLGSGSAWLAVLASGVPSAIAGGWVLLQWLATRRDKSAERTQTQRERDAAEIQTEREKLSARTNVWIDWIQSDNKALRERIKEVESERDKCERQTDAYRRLCYELRGLMREARAIADAQARVNGGTDRPWPPEPRDPDTP